MLQPAAITALLSQLIREDRADSTSVRPHTALLTLVDSSELYAVATKLVDAPPSRSAVASILASTAAAAGTAPPPPTHISTGRPAPLTLDERAGCLSAIAVTSWRQATEAPQAKPGSGGQIVVMPGATVSVAKHAVTGMTSASGEKAPSKELVPLLLESDLGRILVMPIVPSAPILSPSRNELAAAAIDESHDDAPSFADHRKPFMLLTLNAPSDALSGSNVKAASTPQNVTGSNNNSNSNSNTLSPALASSTATLSANNTARSRLRSGVTTPTSTRSDITPTPSRSPVSDHFPITASGGPQGASTTPAAAGEEDVSPSQSSADADQDAREAKVWSALYAQAKALARVLAPSLTKCGVGQHHVDDHVDGRHSGAVSDDDGGDT
ncbi:hypothetical protein EX895_001405 [Sporisorium graminicola]|uniref:Uncharacterized protein n=1 Tax=Sporisorium graminicola TaxID=280036 RepID=A0A4U7KYI6_9BASI|nr:hypothetical protein EX895_001405 [Sporisorium graminicola]TKY89620.1 hypothetical protein EX895_001405 [Sporisorium graminicola]